MISKYKISDAYYFRSALLPLGYQEEVIEKNSLLNEAIFLGSKIAFKELIIKGKSYREILSKYVHRSMHNTSPFGFFCAISPGYFFEKEIIDKGFINKKHLSLDYSVLLFFKDIIEKDKKLGKDLFYFPNATLYNNDTRFKYFNYVNNNYSINSFDKNDVISVILNECKSGLKIPSIYNIIKTLGTYEDDEIYRYIHLLLDQNILVSELAPSYNDTTYFVKLLDYLKANNKDSVFFNSLYKIDSLLHYIKSSDSFLYDYYKEIESIVFNLGFKGKNIFNGLLERNWKNFSLNIDTKKSLLDAVKVLYYLHFFKEQSYFRSFKDEFIKKYGTNRVVHFTDLIDDDIGLEFFTKHLVDYSFVAPLFDNNVPTPTEIKKSKLDIFLDSKIKNNPKSVSIDPSELEFHSNLSQLSNSFSIICEVFKCNDKLQFYLKNIGGASSINLMNRFTSCSDDIANIAKDIINLEFNDNLTDVFYHDNERTLNIVSSSVKRDSSIVLKGLKNQSNIYLEDILIKIDNDEIILINKNNNKIINPILSNSHDFLKTNNPIYKFLSSLSYQKQPTGFNFTWSSYFLKKNRLPEVKVGDCIISPAMWKLCLKDINKLIKEGNSKYANEWLSLRDIPSQVGVVDIDYLVINLVSIHDLINLQKQFKNKKHIWVSKYYQSNSILKYKNNVYANEFVFSIFKDPL